LKLWLLDADIMIDFLSLDVLDALAAHHEVFASSTVIDEVKFFRKEGIKHGIDFRCRYVASNIVRELSATPAETKEILLKLPQISCDTLDAGELESLVILYREKDLIFCSCDAAAIRTLPFLDLSDRGISAESLMKDSGLPKKGLKPNHTDEYFVDNLRRGQEEKIYSFKTQKHKSKKT
jgi:hypothetical protein